MSNLIVPGAARGPQTIVLPDGSEHQVQEALKAPPMPWELLQREISEAGTTFAGIVRSRRIVRATLVEALAFKNMSKVA